MDNLEKLKDTARDIEKEGSPFMEPKIEKPKGNKGRPPLSDAEKAQRAKDRAEKQKQDAKNATPKHDQGPAQSSGAGAAFSIPSKEIMRPLVSSMSMLAVEYAQDKRASMTPDEEDAFCEVGGKLLDKYAPGVFDKYGLEATALILIAMYGRRVVALKKVIEYEKQKTEPTAQAEFKPMQPTSNETDLKVVPPMESKDSWQNENQPNLMI